jgi:hypothetical protein
MIWDRSPRPEAVIWGGGIIYQGVSFCLAGFPATAFYG